MVKRGQRRLSTKTARKMVTWSHYRFKQTLKHQAAKYGCVVVDVTEEYTSKTCSKCGHIHTKLGGNKRFVCPDCGHAIGRDINGAFNPDVEGFERSLCIWRDNFIPDCAILRKFRQLPDFSGLNVSDAELEVIYCH